MGHADYAVGLSIRRDHRWLKLRHLYATAGEMYFIAYVYPRTMTKMYEIISHVYETCAYHLYLLIDVFFSKIYDCNRSLF